MKTIKVTTEVWKKLKLMALEREITIGKILEELINESK